MKKILVCTALALSLSAVPALAKGKPAGRGNDKHEDKSEKWKDKGDKDKDRKDRDHKKDWRDHDRDHDRDHGRVANNGRPPGWDKGKKTGWGNCDVPPGQAKKQGCRSTHSTRPVVVSHRKPQDHQRRTVPTNRRTTTTTTTTTTTSTGSSRQGTHPFTPVLREKQRQGGSTDAKSPRQSVK